MMLMQVLNKSNISTYFVNYLQFLFTVKKEGNKNNQNLDKEGVQFSNSQ